MINGDDACDVCGKAFTEALGDGSADWWTFHWMSATSSTLAGETCGEECADKFEKGMGR